MEPTTREARATSTSPRTNHRPPPPTRRWLVQLWTLLLMISVPAAVHAQLPGAIFTSERTGTTVNGNLYQNKEDVYLNGGPQSAGGAQLPDGTYYFQVTDPSGAVLLSNDDIAMRRLQVVGGHVLGAVAPGHANGDPWLDSGGMTQRQGVQLYPFDSTPNLGGVYKVWLTPVERYAPGEGSFGFLGDWSKTDNFKVDLPLDDDPITTFVIRKYHDRNGDGTRGAGEESLSGWQFNVFVTDVDGNSVTTTPANPTTDANGEVVVTTELLPLSRYPLQWKVREVQQSAPWRQTEPHSESMGSELSDGQWCWSGTDTVGGAVVTVDFGNAQFASLAGTKFNDQNGDAVRDPNEPGLPGFTIQIVATFPDGYVRTEIAVSSLDGRWSAGPYPLGTQWVVSETTPPDPWRQTYPAGGGAWTGILDADRDDIDFGNARFVTLHGVKYHDQNGNGARDSGEPGLPGWKFVIQVGDAAETVASDEDGRWSSANEYLEGSFTLVFEEGRSGWEQTEPGYGAPWVGMADEGTEIRFGNARLFRFQGEKYHDRNGNGMRDPDEPGLEGFVFQAKLIRGDGEVGEWTVVSGPGGTWESPEMREGSTYTVSEVLDGFPGWEQTEPAGGIGYSGIVSDNLRLRFGNIRIASLAGRKFYDRDHDGKISERDALATGLAGISIAVEVRWNGGTPTTETILTAPDGTWSTLGRYREGSTFAVREVVPSGWIRLFPLSDWTGTIGSEQWPIDVDNAVHGLDFLNVRLGAGGGLTIGFWSNKNGNWVLANGKFSLDSNLAFLRSLNLVDANGQAFNPTTIAQWNSWLLNATAKNMSYALSVQLAAMELNVRLAPVRLSNGSVVGGVSSSSIVWAPFTMSGGSTGYATIGDLMAEANTFLGIYPSVPSGHPMRARAEALKNALDNANNNRSFVLDLP